MEEVETPEEVLAKQHRKEKKDLQAKIQSMKNAVPKNDKKRRKQLMEDVAKLEEELRQRQGEELSQGEEPHQVESVPATKVDEASDGVARLSVEPEEEEEEEEARQPRVTKAQKRRDKKAAAERERDGRIAEAEVKNLQGVRHQEALKLAHKLTQRQLQIKEISSDGHCMYRAIQDQLGPRGAGDTTAEGVSTPGLSLKDLRVRTADHMRRHADDFLPFLTNTNTGDMYTADEFEKYCSDVEHTAAWGGQLELRALTQVLQMPIEVIQADAATIKIGEEYDVAPVTLIYMRHAYGLGEHYNSVERLKDPANEEDS